MKRKEGNLRDAAAGCNPLNPWFKVNVVTVLRLLGRAEHAHQPWSATFLWYEISAQGTGPLTNISEKFCSCDYSNTVKCKVLFKLLPGSFAYATLLKQCLFDGLLEASEYALLHAGGVVAGFRFS